MTFHKCHSDKNVKIGEINISLTLKWAQSAVIIEVNRSENPKGVALWMPLAYSNIGLAQLQTVQHFQYSLISNSQQQY